MMRGWVLREGLPGQKVRARRRSNLLATVSGYTDPFTDTAVSNVAVIGEGGFVRMFLEPDEYVFDDPDNDVAFAGSAIVEPKQFIDLTHPLIGGRGVKSESMLVDNTVALQKGLAAAKASYGALWIPGRLFGLSSSLDMGVDASLVGEQMWASCLMALPSLVGPGLRHLGDRGAVGNGPKSKFHNWRFEGSNAGIVKHQVTVTLGSDIATFADPATLAQAKDGDWIEAVFIPKNTKLTKLTAITARLSNAATGNNMAGPEPKPTAITRPAWTVSAVATEGSPELILTVAGSAPQARRGQRASGARIDDDDGNGGLSANALVESADDNRIVIDRPAKTSGTFTLTFWTENIGIRIQDRTLADQSKDVEAPDIYDVLVHNFSGTGLDVGTGRVRCHVKGGRYTENWGDGQTFRGANDSYNQRVGRGANWRRGTLYVAMATVRDTGEVYLTKQPDKYPDLHFQGCREAGLLDSDFNGTILFTPNNSANPEQNHSWFVAFCHAKYFVTNRWADQSAESYIKATGGHVDVIGVKFKGDPRDYVQDNAQPVAKPQYLVSVSGAKGSAHITGCSMPMDTADPYCPYSVAPGNSPAVSFDIKDTGTGLMMRFASLNAWGFTRPADVPLDRGYQHVFGDAPLGILGKLDLGSSLALVDSAYQPLPLTEGGNDKIENASQLVVAGAAGLAALNVFTLRMSPTPRHGALHRVFWRSRVRTLNWLPNTASNALQAFTDDTVLRLPDSVWPGDWQDFRYDAPSSQWLLEATNRGALVTYQPQANFATPGTGTVFSYAEQLGRYSILGGVCTFSGVLRFTPTYTDAADALRITGLPPPRFADSPCNVSSESVNNVWQSTGFTQLSGAINAAGGIVVRCTGRAKNVQELAAPSLPSGLEQRFLFWGSYFV